MRPIARVEHALKRCTVMVLASFAAPLAVAADLTARSVADALFRATAPVDFASKDLSFLDLAGLDFKQARLAGANLYGADLNRASLKGANLEGAKLDNAIVTRSDFSSANLKGATLLSVTAFATLEPDRTDAPNFENANLRGAHIAARLDGANFRNADLSEARIGLLIATWGSYRPRAVFNGADFTSAKLVRADLHKGVFQFTKFLGADLTGAKLVDCDFTKADLTGANFAGADIAGADFDGAILTNATGLDMALGRDSAKNLDKSIR